MSVIGSSLLLVRRIAELQRRRESLARRARDLREQLPDWAIQPLCLAGMTEAEIRGRLADLSRAEEEAGLDTMEGQLERMDRELDELDCSLLCTPSTSLEGVEAVLDLAVERLRALIPSDPQDLFYDHGEARALALLERVLDDLRDILLIERRDAV